MTAVDCPNKNRAIAVYVRCMSGTIIMPTIIFHVAMTSLPSSLTFDFAKASFAFWREMTVVSMIHGVARIMPGMKAVA